MPHPCRHSERSPALAFAFAFAFAVAVAVAFAVALALALALALAFLACHPRRGPASAVAVAPAVAQTRRPFSITKPRGAPPASTTPWHPLHNAILKLSPKTPFPNQQKSVRNAQKAAQNRAHQNANLLKSRLFHVEQSLLPGPLRPRIHRPIYLPVPQNPLHILPRLCIRN
jgi:hypothetical protein